MGFDIRADDAAAARARAESRARQVSAAEQDDGLVWHYTDGTGLISILRSHTLWATASSFLNDQQEIELGFERIAERLRDLAAQDGREVFVHLAERFENPPPELMNISPATFFILSASQHWDSLAMWRNYGGVAESYAVALDAASPLAVLDESGSIAGRDPLESRQDGVFVSRHPWRPVRYRPEEQRELVDAVFDELPDQLAAVRATLVEAGAGAGWDATRAVEPGDRGLELLDELEQALLLIKHEGFLDERETRYSVVAWEAQDDPVAAERMSRLVSHRSTTYGVAPYLRLTGSADGEVCQTAVAPLPIRAVAISPSPNGAVATASVEQLLRASGYADLPVLRSAIPFRSG